MENINKPSITRLFRIAGVKSFTSECFDVIRRLVENKLEEIIHGSLVIKSESNRKILTTSDIYNYLESIGYNMALLENGNINHK